MAEMKSQHYVSRFYLRRFASDAHRKAIGLFHLPSGKYVPHAPIKHEACKDYFYGGDAQVEDVLAPLDTLGSEHISAIVKEQQLPDDREAYKYLICYTLLQHDRTLRAAEEYNEALDKTARAVLSKDPKLAGALDHFRFEAAAPAVSRLGVNAHLWVLACDLKGRLFKTDASCPFLTSDAPVVYYNQFMEGKKPVSGHLGIASTGLQIFFPLSPELQLFLYDGEVYGVDGPASKAIPVSPADVDALNLLQCASANDKVYFCAPSFDQQCIEGLVENAKRFRRRDKSTVREYRAADGSPSSLLTLSFPGVVCRLKLSIVRVLRKARKLRRGNKVVRFRNEQLARQVSREFRGYHT